ncbi:hypothetical protein N9L19_00925 [bacterium]|nr:hypothetical protein [bacterium]
MLTCLLTCKCLANEKDLQYGGSTLSIAATMPQLGPGIGVVEDEIARMLAHSS